MGTHANGNSLGNKVLADGFHRPAYAVHAFLLNVFHAFTDVIGSNDAMSVHADDDLAFGLAQGDVHAGGDDPAGIIQDRDRRPGTGGRGDQRSDLCAGVVGGHAVNNKDFHAIRRVILGKDGLKSLLDVGGFVTDGEDEGDGGVILHWDAQSLKLQPGISLPLF